MTVGRGSADTLPHFLIGENMRALDLVGQKYGRLTVISNAPTRRAVTGYTHRYWLCLCECGTKKEISVGDLRSGNTNSCGCLLKETRSKNGRARATHGETHREGGKHGGTLRWNLWRAALERSRKSNLPFDLKLVDVVVPPYCPVLGIPIFKVGGRQSDNSPSLDKLIPELGYVKGNVYVISFRANKLKGDATLEEMKAVVRYMEGPDVR